MPFKLIYELEKLLSICYNPKELAMTEQSGLPLPQRGLHKLQAACMRGRTKFSPEPRRGSRMSKMRCVVGAG